MSQYGDFDYEGKTYEITQLPYVGDDGEHYKATAVDEEGNQYMVVWQTTIDWDARDIEDQSDESEACDWDNPSSVTAI